MKNNAKYTALEILTSVGVENPEEALGKVRVRIGGVAGIVSPDHLIVVPAGTEKLEVVVGTEKLEIDLSNNEDFEISEAASLALEEKGKKAIAQAKKNAEIKAKKVEK